MKVFISNATRLAFTRQRLVKGRRALDEAVQRDEAELLSALTASRAALQAPPTAFVGYPQHPGWPPQVPQHPGSPQSGPGW
jgi:hypothetical protein